MFLVSALVSVYNASKWLPTRLENLLGQTLGSRLQIILIDSGSQENEEEIVGRYPGVEYLRTPRESLYAAWNRGIALARGEFLTSANADDRLLPDALEKMAAALQEDASLGLVYADQWQTEDEAAVLHWDGSALPTRVRRSAYSHRRLLLDCICGPQPVWRRSLHEEFGLFDASFQACGDWEFWLRIAEKVKMRHLDEVLGLYFRNRRGLEHCDVARVSAENKRIRMRYFQ